MITKFYADNFRGLINFELNFGEQTLFLGPNGSGKTTVFDLLRRIQDLVVGGKKVAEVFTAADLSQLQKSTEQRFELSIRLGKEQYDYKLSIEHDPDHERMRIKEERLDHDNRALFVFKGGKAQLYRDDYTTGPEYPFDWTQSGLGVLNERPENRKLTRFRREVGNWIIVHPCPPLYQEESRGEDEMLSWHMENFASWYRRIVQENMGAVTQLFGELREMLPGFDSLSMVESGERSRVLKTVFRSEAGDAKTHRYNFGQLSDGQRGLIALYALMTLLPAESRFSLFIDEPDNYLSLREIEPWLKSLVDLCGETVEQAVIISHHPKVIDYLGKGSGRWFSREAEGPVRVSSEPKQAVDGLTLSETVARSW